MKRFSQYVCLLLVCIMIIGITAGAEGRSMDASDYFGVTTTYLYEVSGMQFQVYFRVTAVEQMDELGASVVKVQRSSNGSDWETVHTRTKENYTSMIGYDTGNHSYSFTYNGTAGYQYRAYVEFYAKKDNGTGYFWDYTEVYP